MACGFVAALAVPAIATAQTYPTRPVRMIVPYAPGGVTDVYGRMTAHDMERVLGQSIVVDNRPGGGGGVGTGVAAKAAPDGYTMVLTSAGPLIILPTVQKDLPYDPYKDFVPIGQVFDSTMLLSVRTDSKIGTLRDLVEAAKARPGKLTYSHPGAGSQTQLYVELFKAVAGIDLTSVPYKGELPAFTDFIAGRIDVTTGSYGTVLPYVKNGTVKILAQFGDARSPVLPDVPTAKESGFAGAVAGGWAGLNAPTGTPAAAIGKLSESLVFAMKNREIREKLNETAYTAVGSTPEAYGEFLKAEQAKWVPLLRKLNLKME